MKTVALFQGKQSSFLKWPKNKMVDEIDTNTSKMSEMSVETSGTDIKM